MALADKLFSFLGFARPDTCFELLETEEGMPGGFSTAEKSGKTGYGEKDENMEITGELLLNEQYLRRRFRADINPDVVFRAFRMGDAADAFLVYMNGMADDAQISDFILRDSMKGFDVDEFDRDRADYAAKHIFTMAEIRLESEMNSAIKDILDGLTAVFIDGADKAVVMDTRGYEHRGVSLPQNEKSTKGPHEAFVESIRTNITLIRRNLRCEDLIADFRPCGAENGIKAAIVYRDGVANEALLDEVRRRIGSIRTRSILSAGTLMQLCDRRKLALFPDVLSTERPDRTAAMLMQGYVAVLLDGSPFANIMPATLFALMSTSEDYSLGRFPGSLIRLVRYVGAVISVVLPGYFIAIALFHQGLISTEVLVTVIASRKMVFAPITSEMLFLLLVFQLIREAGMRVPGSIGQAIGIIGGLILGQAAITANLASSVILIVVALTGLGNFCIPDYSTQLSASAIRLIIIAAARMAGLLGLCSAIMMILAWMVSMKSYGMPFMTPYAPAAVRRKPAILRGKTKMHMRSEDTVNAEDTKN